MWFYVGLGMFVTGLVLLNCFGITQEERKQGKAYTTSDRIGSLLFVGGSCISLGTLLWWLGEFLYGLLQQLFYGAGAAYVEYPIERYTQLSLGAALFFALALMLCFRAESQFREYRRSDHAKARRIQARHFHYARIFIRVGQVILLAGMVCFALKRL